MNQPELPFNGFPPFVGGSDTSLLAAEQIEPSAGTLRRVVLDYLRRAGGATDEQIGDALSMQGNTVRPRRRELELSGLVAKSSERRRNHSGRWAVVWRAA